MQKKTFLIVIVIIGLVLRCIWITRNSLYGDEVTIGLDAYTLAQTLRDQRGNILPFTFEMRGGSPPGYIYATIPFVKLLGNSELAVRAPSLLAGIGLIILGYLLGKQLFGQKTGIIASLLMALSYGDISLSRAGFESHLALFLLWLGIYHFFRKHYFQAGTWIVLSSFTYPTYKLTAYFVGVMLFFYWLKEKKFDKEAFFFFVICLFGSVVIIASAFFANSERRFVSSSIFADRKIESLSDVGLVTKSFIHNYTDNISINYLFLKGDSNPRHNPSELGLFNPIILPLLIIGLLVLVKKHDQNLWFLILTILLSPLPAALMGNAHFLRNSLMLMPVLLIAAVGVDVLSLHRKSLIFLTVLYGLGFMFFAKRLYISSYRKNFESWSFSAKQTTSFIHENYQNYNLIFVSASIDNIEYAYPYYTTIPAEMVIINNQMKFEFGGRQFKKYDKVLVGDIDSNFLANLKLSGMMAISAFKPGECDQTLYYPDGRSSLCIRTW